MIKKKYNCDEFTKEMGDHIKLIDYFTQELFKLSGIPKEMFGKETSKPKKWWQCGISIVREYLIKVKHKIKKI